MRILAIDPGTHQSGYVIMDSTGEGIESAGVLPNHEMLDMCKDDAIEPHPACDVLAIEMVASYGMPVGAEVFETVRWIGRFQQAWLLPESGVIFVYRKDVKIHLCGTVKAKDANIRQALIDKIGPQGTKKQPGPTYGVKSHAWPALAVAITALETTLADRIASR